MAEKVNDSQQNQIKLKAGSSLFAVSDALDPGTCGPYFTDKARAVLWAFYTSISDSSMTPQLLRQAKQTGRHSKWVKGTVATEWLFCSNSASKNGTVIIEIVLNCDVTFSNTMIDPNPFIYVTYRFGSHDPVSSTVQLNTDNDNVSLMVSQFANDRSWLAPTKPKVSYYGLMTMFPQQVTKDCRSWIMASNQNGKNIIDANASFNLLFKQILIAQIAKAEKYHETIIEVGIRIHAPEELTQARYYYSLNWEQLWLFFTAWLYQGLTIAQINQAILSVLEHVCPSASKTVLPPVTEIVNLDANLISEIITHCDSLKDAIALLSVNRHWRFNLYHRALIQSNLRIRFLPSIDDFFGHLPEQNSPDRVNLLGLPKKSVRSDKWWNLGGVLFTEDFSTTEEQESSSEEDDDVPKLIAIRRRSVCLEPRLVLPLIRNSNSFMIMFSMLYSLDHYSTMPRLVSLVINHTDSHGVASVKVQATARMPEYMPSASRTAIEMLSATTVIDYPYTVSQVNSRGSWLHDISIPYFFLEPSFAAKLENAKAFEKQRYLITMHYMKLLKAVSRGNPVEITPSHRQALRTPLINTLKLLQGEKPIAYINCYTASGLWTADLHPGGLLDNCPEYVEIFLDAREINPVKILELVLNRTYSAVGARNAVSLVAYDSRNEDLIPCHPALMGVNANNPYEVLETTQVARIHFDLNKSLTSDQTYYEAYMLMTVLIRLLIHEHDVTTCNWSVNF